MMTSVLVSPDGVYEYEAAHGTVHAPLLQISQGREQPPPTPSQHIFAWTGALRKRGELDDLPELSAFADKLEKATLQTIEEDGIMTGDLAAMSTLPNAKKVDTEGFLLAIRDRLEQLL